MRIICPYCGDAAVDEFVYHGDAAADAAGRLAADRDGRLVDYVYLRDNPAGPHREFWYHAAAAAPGWS